MATVRPFRALRPVPTHAAAVAAPPYDVVDTGEARAVVSDRPHDFLRVTRAEVELSEGADPYRQEVYLLGKKKLQALQEEGVMRRDDQERLYLYQQVMGSHVQTGLVALCSCEEYDQGIVRKHEFTRPDKEADRVRHITTLEAQTGPVLLTYRAVPALDEVFARICATPPEVDFEAADQIQHRCWTIQDEQDLATIRSLFAEQVSLLYIADGHHRSAAASLVAKAHREQDPQLPKQHGSQFFLSVIFPHHQMQILPYHRLVHDLGELSEEDFLQHVDQRFERTKLDEVPTMSPPASGHFDMFFQQVWWRLTLRPAFAQADDPVSRLDVSLLQKHLLSDVLQIHDPRRDQRISFVGGIRGYKGLEALARRHPQSVALACYPTSVEQLLEVADANEVMPPKSTWFEPKLRSGLYVHLLKE